MKTNQVCIHQYSMWQINGTFSLGIHSGTQTLILLGVFFYRKIRHTKNIQQYKIKLWKFTVNAFPEITFWGFICIGNSEKLKHQDSAASLSVDFPFPTKKHKRKKTQRENDVTESGKKETKT